MLNNATIVGRLTADPDLRYTSNGTAVANFRLAVNRPFKNQNGENEADFINCVVWKKPAENLAQYMGKGSQIGVTGRIQTRTFQNKQDQTVFVTEVVADQVAFLESKNSGHKPQQEKQQNSFKDNGEPIDISDEDLPF